MGPKKDTTGESCAIILGYSVFALILTAVFCPWLFLLVPVMFLLLKLLSYLGCNSNCVFRWLKKLDAFDKHRSYILEQQWHEEADRLFPGQMIDVRIERKRFIDKKRANHRYFSCLVVLVCSVIAVFCFFLFVLVCGPVFLRFLDSL